MNAAHHPFRRAALAALGISVLATPGLGADATAAQPAAPLPPPASRGEVSFALEVQPLLERSCLRCHGAERPKGGLRLDTRAGVLAGGHSGAAVIPGDAARSPLLQAVARTDPDTAMPPEGKGDPLVPAEVDLLRAWIDQGAHGSSEPASPSVAFSVTPAVQFVTVRGNEARFREHYWMREGWGGGASDFSLRYDLDPRTHVSIDGRAVTGPDDYQFDARIRRDDLGWVRFGYSEFSRYYDDTGGYHPAVGFPVSRLGEDLRVRRRQATLEAGLDLPDWPKIRLAYDLLLRDGSESTLNWGGIGPFGTARAVFPGRKSVDETTHLITLELEHDWNGLLISDLAQFEWHAQDNQRVDFDSVTPPLDFTNAVRDRQDYWRGANAFRLERQLRDWLYLSGGYLFSHLRDAGGLSVVSTIPSDPTLPPSIDIHADDLVLRRQSHVVNGNAMLGPWEKLHFYAGLQSEWTRQEGFASGRRFGTAVSYDANLDRVATSEHFGLRYEGLPHTVFFAETRFQQESIAQFEEGLGGPGDFLRDTDADGDLKDYEAGFTVSPWTRASLMAKYRIRDRRSDYAHLRDIDLGASTDGYPAFIRARDTRGDEFETRLVLQPLRWLKTTLKYSLGDTDFRTTVDAWQDLTAVPPVLSPGGRIVAGEYDAHTVSAGLVFTPWTRFHLSTTAGWTTSRSRSGIPASNAEVVPWEGDTWNVLNSATLLLDEKTDLLATYLFSSADFAQGNAATGLPLGIEYTRHAATGGIVRRMKHDRQLRLEYGYYAYDEPTLGGAADYTAHAVFASFRLPWK